MADCIRLACARSEIIPNKRVDKSKKLVTPGDLITDDTGFFRGHGTYDIDQALHASVAGIVQQVHRLISVKPIKTRYNGEIGDRIVGRVTEVQQKRWKVDTNSRMDSVLNLTLVNLPSGELRRRSAEDELMMRQILQEGDLISAEVHQVYSDGSLSLTVKDLNHGKLSQGTLIRVSPSVIQRCKVHYHTLEFGVSVILGNNGLIWVCATAGENMENAETTNYKRNLQTVSKTDRENVARVRNCILALANSRVMLNDTSIIFAYEESLKYPQIKDLLKPEIIADIAENTRERFNQLES